MGVAQTEEEFPARHSIFGRSTEAMSEFCSLSWGAPSDKDAAENSACVFLHRADGSDVNQDALIMLDSFPQHQLTLGSKSLVVSPLSPAAVVNAYSAGFAK